MFFQSLKCRGKKKNKYPEALQGAVGSYKIGCVREVNNPWLIMIKLSAADTTLE